MLAKKVNIYANRLHAVKTLYGQTELAEFLKANFLHCK